VYNKLSQFCASFVAVTPMPYEKFRKMAEMLDRKVSSKTGLATFLSNNPNSNISSLYHRDIVPAVSNAADTFLGVFADEFRNIGFLRWGAAAGDNCGQTDG
jgi:hypothetical protein